MNDCMCLQPCRAHCFVASVWYVHVYQVRCDRDHGGTEETAVGDQVQDQSYGKPSLSIFNFYVYLAIYLIQINNHKRGD